MKKRKAMHRKLVLLLLTLLLAYSFILSGCSKSGTLVLSGTIEATQVDVSAETNGKILEITKSEGSPIDVNEVLASLDSAASRLQMKQAEAGVKAARARLNELKAGSRAEQLLQAEAAAKAAKAGLDELKAGSRAELLLQGEAAYRQSQELVSSAQKNYDYRVKNLENLKQLQKAGGASQQQVDDGQNLLDAAIQQLTSAKEQQSIAGAQLELLKNGATPQAIQAAEANYEQALAQWELLKNGSTAQSIEAAEANLEQLLVSLDLAKLQLEKCEIKSPVKGILLYKTADPGQVVMPGSIIGTIQVTDDYWIKVYIPQKFNGRVALHQKVRITTSSLPGENIDGTVIFKSPRAEFTPKNVETVESREENTVIQLKVKVDSHIDRLSAGMTANVHID